MMSHQWLRSWLARKPSSSTAPPLAAEKQLRAQVIRLPGFHHLLDGLALADFFVQHLARQRRQLRVAREPQRNQLAHRERPDARLQVRRQRPLVAQPLFQPNDPVLHLQRHHPRAEESYRQPRRQQHPFGSIPRKSRRIPPVNRPEKIDGQYRHNEKVKLRKKFPVIRKILLSHVVGPPFHRAIVAKSAQVERPHHAPRLRPVLVCASASIRAQYFLETEMPKATWAGKVIADSGQCVVVEGNQYFPPDAVKKE